MLTKKQLSQYGILFGIVLCMVSCLVNNCMITKKSYTKTNVNFIHIPKNAGTYIEDLGKENDYAWGRHNRVTEKDSNNISCSHWHVPPRYMKDKGANLYKDSHTFCVLRDPYERIVSEFKYAYRAKKEFITKENLNKYIHTLPDIIKKNKFAQDCHLIPQHEYIYDENGKQTCNTILDFDNLNANLQHFNSNLQLGIKHIDDTKVNDTSFSKLSKHDLDPKSLKIIQTIYAEDFALFR